MRFSLLFFSFFLIRSLDADEPFVSWYSGRIVLRLIPKFDHINGTEILMKLSSLEDATLGKSLKDIVKGNLRDHDPEYEYLCGVFYCHKDNKNGCNQLCSDRVRKINYKAIFNRIWHVNSTVPTPNKEACLKDCNELCGPNDCNKECVALVDIHFSYKNRKEVEHEFKELLKLMRWSRENPMEAYFNYNLFW